MAAIGDLTFLYTDIEGSTALWEQHPEEMRQALKSHDGILRSAISHHSGSVFSTAGDAFAAAFGDPNNAVAAAAIQSRLEAEEWPTSEPIRVRVGLHAGAAHERDGDYFGPTLNRTARLMSAAHGGQTVCSVEVADLVRTAPGIVLSSLGEHRLKDLLDSLEIFQLGTGRFPELRSGGVAVAGLPEQRSPLIGRASELARLVNMVKSGTLVTVVGPGGIGKTRLALQAAAEAADLAVGGAVLVDLSTAKDPESMWSSITQALDLSTQGTEDIEGRLVAALRARPRVLVWDNCEQVAEEVGNLIETILTGASSSVLVATSREPLDVGDEIVLRLGPLGAADAVALLTECASRAEVSLDDSGGWVGTVSQALDGIPLAIELAARRLRSVPLQEMAGLTSDLLTVLDRPAKGRPGRQRTLRNAIDWSVGMLPPETRTAYARLAALAGSFDARAGAAVCQLPIVEAVGQLSELVDKSMLELAVAGRYRLLEPLRLYGRELLDESGSLAEVEDLQAAHFAERARELAPRFASAEHQKATDESTRDVANFRQALRCTIERRPLDAASLYADLGWYWYHSGSFVEGIAWGNRCLGVLDGMAGVEVSRARCLTAVARLSFYRGDAATAVEQAMHAVELARPDAPTDTAYALVVAAVAKQALGQPDALVASQEARDTFREAGDDWGLASASFYFGVAAIFLAKPELAGPPLDEAGALFIAMGDEWGVGGVTFYRGVLARSRGDEAEARDLIGGSVEQFRRTPDRWRLMFALSTLADLEDGDAADAARAEADGLRQELGLG